MARRPRMTLLDEILACARPGILRWPYGRPDGIPQALAFGALGNSPIRAARLGAWFGLFARLP